jgi:hypothetical protein
LSAAITTSSGGPLCLCTSRSRAPSESCDESQCVLYARSTSALPRSLKRSARRSGVRAWRQGRIETLEGSLTVNPAKLSAALRLLERWAHDRGLVASETAYVAATCDGASQPRPTKTSTGLATRLSARAASAAPATRRSRSPGVLAILASDSRAPRESERDPSRRPRRFRLESGAPAARSLAHVILFGSYAHGEPDAKSDIDFLVVQQDGFSHRREIVRLQETLSALRIPAEI